VRAQKVKDVGLKVISLGLLTILGGVATGTALAVYDLNRFSPIPSTALLIFPFIVGMIIGILTTGFSQALVVFLLTLLVYALTSFFTLSLPELIHAHLGREITMQLSVVHALANGIIYILPLTIIGIILGKIISRGD
jgi:hypothetical protein